MSNEYDKAAAVLEDAGLGDSAPAREIREKATAAARDDRDANPTIGATAEEMAGTARRSVPLIDNDDPRDLAEAQQLAAGLAELGRR
jgi:hypothetical protein